MLIPQEAFMSIVEQLTKFQSKKVEVETEMNINNTVRVASIIGYWVGSIIRIDIKFR